MLLVAFLAWRGTRGTAAPFVALLLNMYAWIDMIAMAPSVLDAMFQQDQLLFKTETMILGVGMHGVGHLM